MNLHRDVGINDRWKLLGATTAEGGFLVRWDEPFEYSSLPNYYPPQYRWVVNTATDLVVVDLPGARSFGDDRRRVSQLWLDRSGNVMTWEGPARPDVHAVQEVQVYRWHIEGRRAVPTGLGTYCVRPVTPQDAMDTVRLPRPC